VSNSKHILQQFHTIVQPPTLSDQEFIAKLQSTKHLTSIIGTF